MNCPNNTYFLFESTRGLFIANNDATEANPHFGKKQLFVRTQLPFFRAKA